MFVLLQCVMRIHLHQTLKAIPTSVAAGDIRSVLHSYYNYKILEDIMAIGYYSAAGCHSQDGLWGKLLL